MLTLKIARFGHVLIRKTLENPNTEKPLDSPFGASPWAPASEAPIAWPSKWRMWTASGRGENCLVLLKQLERQNAADVQSHWRCFLDCGMTHRSHRSFPTFAPSINIHWLLFHPFPCHTSKHEFCPPGRPNCARLVARKKGTELATGQTDTDTWKACWTLLNKQLFYLFTFLVHPFQLSPKRPVSFLKEPGLLWLRAWLWSPISTLNRRRCHEHQWASILLLRW